MNNDAHTHIVCTAEETIKARLRCCSQICKGFTLLLKLWSKCTIILPYKIIHYAHNLFNSRQKLQQKQSQIADAEAARERLMKDHGEMCVKLAQLDKVCTEEKKRKRSLAAEYA